MSKRKASEPVEQVSYAFDPENTPHLGPIGGHPDQVLENPSMPQGPVMGEVYINEDGERVEVRADERAPATE